MTLQPLDIATDVLVIGGGLAGTWAAAAAAQAGARVVLADKGHCGTSGVTATAGPGHWWVPPDRRESAAEDRHRKSGGLGDPEWMQRIMAETWEWLPRLAPYYRFSRDDAGQVQYRALRGPEYMRAMRALILDLGVTILDHAPALELLTHADGSVAGAAGLCRQDHGRPWRITAGATVLATGGCAFMSGLLGSHTNTGDGYLMAAEVGACLSGMEFHSYYCIAPAQTTMTRSMVYSYARFFDDDGQELDIPPGPDPSLALVRALIRGPVLARLDRFPERFRRILPVVQPNTQIVFDRLGLDPYRDKFPVTLHGEGTVRGIGGLRIAGRDCSTDVPGLYACGDAASRELVAGAVSGGGAVNSAWALSSGRFAGQGAALRARRRGSGQTGRAALRSPGRAGLRSGNSAHAQPAELIALARHHILDLERAYFRTEARLQESYAALETAWQEVSDPATPDLALRAREAASVVASARWCIAAARARRESRGLFRREDMPDTDPAQAHRLVLSNLLGPAREFTVTPDATGAGS